MAELSTFVFTDLVGSVSLKGEMPGGSDAERDAAFLQHILTPHRERVENLARDFGGRVVSTAGDGHFLVFGDVTLAARWTMAVDQSHADEPICTPRGTAAQLRISLHLGTPQIDPQHPHNFIGKAVDYAARLNDFAAGGQILVSRAARVILEDANLSGVRFHAHGKRELKGIGEVEVHELLFNGRAPQPTRNAPRAERTREWTLHPDTIGYSQLTAHPPSSSSSSQATALATRRPTRLGNYELGDLVGAGGMGDVFQARHTQFDRLRAVKIIKPHLVAAGQQQVVKRFYQEIKAMGALEHPNIVVAIDSSTPEDQTHYLVMEYVDGISAGELVEQRGPLSVANACEIARQAAVGLDYLARAGMVHRDMKPSNLMLTVVDAPHLSSGTSPAATADLSHVVVKILDLGLALLVGDDHERLTRLDHRPMGTAMYMSPEQWRTTSVDIRSDIYSLGCSLYHLLAGQPPFYDSDLRPEKAHERGRVPAIRRNEGLPKGVTQAIRKCLAKDPQERYQTPAELAEALAPFTEGQTLVEEITAGRAQRVRDAPPATIPTTTKTDRPGSTLPAPPARARPWLLLAALVAGLSILGILWMGDLARQRRVRLVQSEQESLRSNSLLAAERVAGALERRFDLLTRLAQQPDLQQGLVAANAEPKNDTLWEPLQNQIERAKLEHDDDAPSESWFLTDSYGTQVARAARSSSIGKNYAHRDYFHGRGADLSEQQLPVAPIQQPIQSAVYRSTTTGQLKVAFSVPVWNGARLSDQRAVVGILAMSVEMGDFSILERKLPRDKEALLVDLRNDSIEGEPRRGLILHHRDLGNSTPQEAPARLSPELLDQIDRILAGKASSPTSKRQILVNYPDPLGRNSDRYWGAFERVHTRTQNDNEIYTDWLVIVQAKMQP